MAANAVVTYLQKYQQQPNRLVQGGGTYAPLYARARIDSGLKPISILTTYASGDQSIPKMFLKLTSSDDGEYMVRAVHRVTAFACGPEITPYDNKHYGILGDVLPDNSCEMVRFPGHAFDLADEVNVPTIDSMTERLDQLEPGKLLGPFDADAPAVEKVQTRFSIPVPQEYIPILLGEDELLHPTDLWETMGVAIINNQQQEELAPLLDWIRVACTHTVNKKKPKEPANHMGPDSEVFPPFRVDAPFAAFRRSILKADLPQLFGATAPDLTDIANTVGDVLRAEHQLNRAQAERQHREAQQPKLPTEVQPEATRVHLRLVGTDDEANLPAVYHYLAQAKKIERRQAVERAVSERCAEQDAATHITPLVTRELFEMIRSGKVAPRYDQRDDLAVGLSPFTCGYFPDQQMLEAARGRTEAFDLQQSGTAQLTLTETEKLTSKDVPFPVDSWHATNMLQATSVVMDIVQGPGHPHAAAFRRFLGNQWPSMVNAIQTTDPGDLKDVGHMYTRILMQIRQKLSTYLRALAVDTHLFTLADLDMGRGPQLPNYDDIATTVIEGSFHLLPSIPTRYLKSKNPRSGGGGTGGQQPSNTSNNLGAQLQNPSPHAPWIDGFAARNVPLNTVTDPPKDANGNEVCMSFHLRGRCYENCPRRATHVQHTQLSRTIQQKLAAIAGIRPAWRTPNRNTQGQPPNAAPPPSGDGAGSGTPSGDQA